MNEESIAKQYPFPGYNFCMYFDDVRVGFKSISGLTVKKNNFQAYQEGGNNAFLEVQLNRKTELNRLTLTKGVGYFNPAKIKSKINMMLLLVFDTNNELLVGYAFSPGYVESITVSDFDAVDSKVMLDTTVILYDYVEEVNFSDRVYISYNDESKLQTTASQEKAQRNNVSTDEIAKSNKAAAAMSKSKNETSKKKTSLIEY